MSMQINLTLGSDQGVKAVLSFKCCVLSVELKNPIIMAQSAVFTYELVSERWGRSLNVNIYLCLVH